MPITSRTARFLVGAVAALGLLVGCSDDGDTTAADETVDGPTTSVAGTVTVTDAWSRRPADGQTATAVYGVVANPGDIDITVVAASSPVTNDVELHETVADEEGVMQMVERPEGFVVPAGGEFRFEPGGPHVMLINVDPASYPDAVEVTLQLDVGDPLTFEAEVRDVSGDDTAGMDHSDMDHGAMGDEASADGFDPMALHEVDDQLAAGELDPEAQRAVVAANIAGVEAMNPTEGSPEAELLVTLQELDAALAAGDLETASTLAATAHTEAHALEHADDAADGADADDADDEADTAGDDHSGHNHG
ncbi:MAG: copper chaperone PCu(A)C [Acidimicrobiales bacterium]